MEVNMEDMEMNDDLLISYLLKEVSTYQIREVEAWRQQSATNELRFKRFEMIWDTSKKLDLDTPIEANASLARLKEKIKDNKNIEPHTIRLSPKYIWLKAVAALLLISGIAWFFIGQQAIENLQAVTGEVVKVDTLSDGSVVTLNKKSRLEYPSKFEGKQRQVVLAEGEAFFDVTPNKEKPFVITSGAITIRVVGTSFNVKLKNGDVEVIVESGKVQVVRGEKSIFIEPGEKVLVSKTMNNLAKAKTPDLLYNYYRTKMFVADDTPLWRMVEALNEAYDSKIEIKNPAIRDLPLNTTFNDESLEDILQVISRTFKITVEKRQDRIILK
jgi:ferric-dicitrate binding protein FerR (iron transport regulator)